MIEMEADEEQEQELETALHNFEAWASKVRSLLSQAGYEPSYEEKQTVCIVLGLRATVYPDNDMYPNKVDIEIAPHPVL